uniref:PDZ domain-containing protein n=1 Tax=Gadus morhua TaxID=8049 RepID=A0A8C5FFP3_GADMO
LSPCVSIYVFPFPLPSDSLIRLICVSKGTGLGLVIKGGTNSPEGPMVFIQEMVPGGDCQKDGRLQVGDQLVSINKESLIGASNEEAQSILASTKLRPDPTVEIAFIRRRSSSGSSSETQSPTISLQGPVGGTVSQASAPGLGPLHSQAGLLTKLPPVAVRPPPPSIALPTPPVLNVSQALDVLGLKPTDLQRQALRSRLRADTAGTVAYAEFESLSKELFKPQLQDGVPVSQVGSKFSSDDLSSLLESPTNPLVHKSPYFIYILPHIGHLSEATKTAVKQHYSGELLANTFIQSDFSKCCYSKGLRMYKIKTCHQLG